MGRTEAEQRAFLKYADLPTEQENPFLIGHDRIDQILGPKQEGLMPEVLEAAGSMAVFNTAFRATSLASGVSLVDRLFGHTP
jgi:hypothetical protein